MGADVAVINTHIENIPRMDTKMEAMSKKINDIFDLLRNLGGGTQQTVT